MAFNTTAGSAEYVAQGAIGVAGQYTTKRKYSLSDLIIFQERSYAMLDNIFMQESRVIDVDDPQPKVLTMQECPVKFNIKSDDTDTTYEGDTLRLSDTQAVFLQANDVLQVTDLFCDTDGANYTTTKYGSGYNPETVLVQSVTLSGAASGVANVIVRRGNGYNTAAPGAGTVTTILSEYKLIHMGNALSDYGNAATPIQFEPTDVQNYCQFRSRTWSESSQEAPLNVYGKMTMAQKAAMKRKEFFRSREISAFMGIKSSHTSNNNRLQLKEGGIVEFVPRAATALDGTSRLIDFGGAFDLGLLRQNTEIIYRYGNSGMVKHWFVGGKFFTVLYNALEKFISVNDEYSRRYGWKVFELELGHGIAMLHRHPLFTDLSTSSNEYSMDAVIVDLEYLYNMNYIPVQTRNNVQANNVHGREDEIFGQKGVHRTFPDAHAVIYGITG